MSEDEYGGNDYDEEYGDTGEVSPSIGEGLGGRLGKDRKDSSHSKNALSNYASDLSKSACSQSRVSESRRSNHSPRGYP